MSPITFKGNPVEIEGQFPAVGTNAPDFTLIKSDLTTLPLSDLQGKRVIFNIFPSVDTAVCALQLQKFDEAVSNLDNTALLFASLDLPFAFKRFCDEKGIKNAITASDYRHHSLAKAYGVKMNGGPLEGLYARAVLILSEAHQITYSEFVSEVTHEPDYDAAMKALAEI
ncbi:MAG: thiol peroxidase [Cyanobacteria bacterium P01_F01_bin.42]